MSTQPEQIAYYIANHVCFEGEPVSPFCCRNNRKIFSGRVCRVRCDNASILLFMLMFKFSCELLFFDRILDLAH